jgi:4-alpha-glucanotransferase
MVFQKKKRWFWKDSSHPFIISLEKKVLVHFVILWVQFDQEKVVTKLVNQRSFSSSVMADLACYFNEVIEKIER